MHASFTTVCLWTINTVAVINLLALTLMLLLTSLHEIFICSWYQWLIQTVPTRKIILFYTHGLVSLHFTTYISILFFPALEMLINAKNYGWPVIQHWRLCTTTNSIHTMRCAAVRDWPTMLCLASDSSSETASTSMMGLSLLGPVATSPEPKFKREEEL
jgi:hypothetical protein